MLRILNRILHTGIISEPIAAEPVLEHIGNQLRQGIARHFGGSLAIRQVDAGSCNGCELEIHALNNGFYNLEAYGIHFVASPRHADLLLVTGPVSVHMETALIRTWQATPAPKLVIACGDCAFDGGVFGCSYASRGGVGQVIPLDAVIPGCPPSPLRLMQGLLQVLSAMDGLTAKTARR
jgi:Ni,Fe-hydrogenase III small subunit